MKQQLPRRKSYSGFEIYLNTYFNNVQVFVVMVVSILAFSVDMNTGNIYLSFCIMQLNNSETCSSLESDHNGFIVK